MPLTSHPLHQYAFVLSKAVIEANFVIAFTRAILHARQVRLRAWILDIHTNVQRKTDSLMIYLPFNSETLQTFSVNRGCWSCYREIRYDKYKSLFIQKFKSIMCDIFITSLRYKYYYLHVFYKIKKIFFCL